MVATMMVDYAEHFWGDRHAGYHVLYENLKKGEDAVQELSTFVKDRISLEEDLHKSLNKSLMRINNYISNNGAFVDSWRLTKGTFELYCEIQSNVVKNLIDLSRDVIKYHDDLVKSRKRVKEQDVIDAVNMMQTTTTCLQKAKETYQHRCAELQSLKSEPNANAKDLAKMKTKVVKAHEEYRSYVEKYAGVRDTFEEKMIKASRAFQAHDQSHLQQMKTFFIQLASAIDDSQNAVSQVTGDYKNMLTQVDIENIMVKFVEEKGTGNEKPEPIKWSESDELHDLDNVSHITSSQSAPSSSNSSAIIAGLAGTTTATTENASTNNQLASKLVDLDSGSATWTPTTSTLDINKSPHDSDSEIASGSGANNSSSYVSALSNSIGRQKLAAWLPRRKKNASQSSLPPADDSSSFNESTSKSGFLKRYLKAKNSINDLTAMNENKDGGDDTKSTASSARSDDQKASTGDELSTPTASSTPAVDEDGFIIRPPEQKKSQAWSSCTSSSDEDENEFQASKIRQLQIRPVDGSLPKINASVDELRHAIGHISLQRSTTFDRDPWAGVIGSDFTQSLNTGVATRTPLRPAFTGDEHLRRKASADEFAFSQSIGGTTNPIARARARPRSNTPTALTASAFGLTASVSGMSTIASDTKSAGGSSTSDIFVDSKNEFAQGFSDSFSNYAPPPIPPPLPSGVPRHPVAMAVNEYVHAWFKKGVANGVQPDVKVFGTIVVSFPALLVPILTDVNPDLKAFKFSVENASQIVNLMPNKRMVLPTPLPAVPAERYTFTIDKIALANWLLDQQKNHPDWNFYNIDIVRYELVNGLAPPLTLTAYWKTEPTETAIRVDYKLTPDHMERPDAKPLLNVAFTTTVDGEAELTNASPDATYDPETGALAWKLTEITKHGEPTGSLKARLKVKAGPSNPANTAITFTTSDVSMSTVSLAINPEDGYNLSMTRRKVIAGKYFCEPEVFS
uniref:MHD domain-containing protein n=1 Tax=Panagrellus redivivus TaxID=6233 RepID=A0A7E4VJ99_PANRE